MIELRRPQPDDFAIIGREAAEVWVREMTEGGVDLAPLFTSPWTMVAELDGKPLSAGGYVDCGHGAAVSWAIVGNVPRTAFVSLCRAYREHLRRAPFRWIEAHCREGLTQQDRWVRLLGFEPIEGATKYHWPNGIEFKRFVFRG